MVQKEVNYTFLRKYAHWLILIALVVLLEWFKTKPYLVEAYYSTVFYPYIGNVLRIFFGWIPFSIGDLLISVLFLMLIVHVITKIARHIRRRTFNKKILISALSKAVFKLLIIYILFLGLWGLHYYRLGTSHQLQLQPVEYTNADLDTLLTVLQNRLYTICIDSTLIEQQKTQDRTVLTMDAYEAYQKAATQYPFLAFKHSSIKPMLFGPFQSYTGYTGYVFPFTGEAHVNFYVPPMDLPFTVCHEMAHQVGYGLESEANMVGFLACRASEKQYYQYSAYSNMQAYALAEMYNRDSLLYLQYQKSIPSILRKDRIENAKFNKKHKSFLQPLINKIYSQYLKRNNQPMGLKSYNHVVAWMVAYGKKNGWENI